MESYPIAAPVRKFHRPVHISVHIRAELRQLAARRALSASRRQRSRRPAVA